MKNASRQLLFALSLAGLCCFMASCSSPQENTLSKKKPWAHSPKRIPKVKWMALTQDQISWVQLNKRKKALSLLEDVQSHPLEAPAVETFTNLASSPDATGLKPFLVRGVCFDNTPTFTAARVSGDGRILHIHQTTAGAELTYPGYSPKQKHTRNPVVVWLRNRPETVYLTADYGGDKALRSWVGIHPVKWWSSRD